MKMHRVHCKEWKMKRVICESCVRGEHQSYDHDHRSNSEGHRDCKNVGELDKEIVQCTCGMEL